MLNPADISSRLQGLELFIYLFTSPATISICPQATSVVFFFPLMIRTYYYYYYYYYFHRGDREDEFLWVFRGGWNFLWILFSYAYLLGFLQKACRCDGFQAF